MFIVSDWLRSRSGIKIESFEVDDAKFELMNLTSDLFKEVVACESSSDMLDLAANAGISYDRNRVIDDIELSKDLNILWELEGLKYNTEPSLRHKVGEKVCLMSGLSKTLEEMIALEQPEEESIVDGDIGTQDDIALGLAHHEAIMEAS